MNMTSIDFMALIDAPEALVVEFFKLFEIEDKINFVHYRTKELNSFHILKNISWMKAEGQVGHPTL